MEYLLRFLVSHLKQYVRDNWDGERNKNWLIQKYTLLIITLYVAMAASHALYRLKSKYANTSDLTDRFQIPVLILGKIKQIN